MSLESFREETRGWLDENCPASMRTAMPQDEYPGGGRRASFKNPDTKVWMDRMSEKGFTVPTWPKEYGGAGLDSDEARVLREEMGKIQARTPLVGMGLSMIGPALLEYGDDEQRKEHLPKIASGEIWWCQGYSEPNSGSDLASVQTKAIVDGDDYIINGQKVWTSGADNADWIFCLVRTNHDVQKQKGISFILIDMASSGVSVEPLYAFNGKRLWNQVFFDDVRVPISQRLGDEDRGWTVAKSLLGDERLLVSRVAENKRVLNIVNSLVTAQREAGIALPASIASEVAALDIRLQALEMTSLRILTQADAGGEIGAEPSMLKLKGSQLVQDQDELLFRLMDYLVVPQDTKNSQRRSVGPDYAEYVASGRYHHRGYTIAGGSSEVQHNIIAKQVLGL